MTIIYHNDIIQNEPEWYELRRGILTASKMKTLVTPTFKIADNASTKQLAFEMAAQRETKNTEETFQSYDMARGHIEEIYAKDLYSEHYAKITDCGFITNDMLGFPIGMSPDGLVGDVGGVKDNADDSGYGFDHDNDTGNEPGRGEHLHGRGLIQRYRGVRTRQEHTNETRTRQEA